MTIRVDQIWKRASRDKMINQKDKIITGIVTARKCDCCGHHEIGITATDGRYIPFKPGMAVEIRVETEQESGELAE